MGEPIFTSKGTKKMQERMKRLASRTPDVVGKVLRREAELIMTKSKQDYAPVDLGMLKSSGHVGQPQHVGQDVTVTMSYGGAAAAYALAIHEHPSPHDPPSWRGKQIVFSPELGGEHGVKYLEKPMNAAIPGMAVRIGRLLGTLMESDSGISTPSDVPSGPRGRDSRGRFT